MRSLAFIFVAHALLRYPGEDVWSATVISSFLAVFMLVVLRFGGWTSLSGARIWLREHPQIAFLGAGQVVLMAVVFAFSFGAIRISHAFAYLIEALFFSYGLLAALVAFWSAGIASIASWFRHQ